MSMKADTESMMGWSKSQKRDPSEIVEHDPGFNLGNMGRGAGEMEQSENLCKSDIDSLISTEMGKPRVSQSATERLHSPSRSKLEVDSHSALRRGYSGTS